MSKKKEKLIIIDGSAVMYRAWHALPPFSTKGGVVVNALYGFLLAYFKLLNELKPTHVAVAFDLPEPTFRHEQYEAYKAGREEQPDEFYAQFDLLRELLETLHIPAVEAPGYEADDVIGTIATTAQKAGLQTVIATSDLDTLQLVNDAVSVYTFRRTMSDTKEYDEAAVEERFGLVPAQMVDYRALKGDPSDNIPGVKGIGEKTAIALIKKFGSLDQLYKVIKKTEEAEKPLTPRLRQLLLDHEADAEMSKQLSIIQCDVKLSSTIDDYLLEEPDAPALVAKLQEFEFKSILAKLPEAVKQASNTHENTRKREDTTYTFVKTKEEFSAFLKKLKKQKAFAVDTETTGLNVINAELLGASFCWSAGEAYYVYLDGQNEFLKALQPILEDTSIKKWGHNIKYDLEIFRRAGVHIAGIAGDTMIMAYLLNPGARGYSLDDVAFTECGHKMIPITELIGKGKDQKGMREVPLDQLAEYAAEDADFTWRIKEVLLPKIKEQNVLPLLKNIEIPLLSVLADMELVGIKLDKKVLQKADEEVTEQIKLLEQEIYHLAGEEFNIASPKQLKVILFERLELSTEGIGKTKTGFSTAASELEKLRDKHPMVPKLLTYRELTKLHSTYLDALPKQVNKKTGRIHTSFNQTIAATGRLSSLDPNLQNIPIRTEMGQKVRQAFVADKGKVLLAADYSQIELRVVAALAKDKIMLDIFQRGEDIHHATAAAVHGIPESEVTKEIRYTAKEVNFGVLYGMGAWGLAKRTGISQYEAQAFIDKYFAAFASVKKFLEVTKETARKQGYVETLFGRRRYLPEINSGVAQVRQAAERAAINLPVQGTAADIMKLAMIAVAKKLPQLSPDSRMLLQVHDEIVFEVPKAEVVKVATGVKVAMENVADLACPLVVNVSAGSNWGQLASVE